MNSEQPKLFGIPIVEVVDRVDGIAGLDKEDVYVFGRFPPRLLIGTSDPDNPGKLKLCEPPRWIFE